MSLRVVAQLRQSGAGAVAVLGRPEIAGIAVPGGGVDDLLNIDTGGYHALFTHEGPLPDAVVDSLGTFALAVNMLGGGNGIIGRRLREAGISRVIDLDPNPQPDWRGHITDQWLKTLHEEGLASRIGKPIILVSAPQRAEGDRRLAGEVQPGCGPCAIIHPGSGSRSKSWPADRFAELAAILRRNGWRVAVLLGPAEEERMSRAEVGLVTPEARVIRDLPLRELPGLLAACNAFVGNDSGISHLAAAVGARTIAIFGPTDPVQWAPLGERVVVFRDPVAGQWPRAEDVFGKVVDCVSREEPRNDD
jgi:hypothetical protein